ncbi:MAG: transporter substrate-binding domain-containing protein [Pseudomonadota bacterium]
MTAIARLLAVLFVMTLPARAADLLVLVDTGTDMPMARFDHGRLLEGIHKDFGEALAGALGRTARFVTYPRKRIERALASGEGDLLCGYVPEWLSGSYTWSDPFLPITEVLVTPASVARPASLADVAGQRLGTVLGYYHPELEAALGKGFVRENGPNALINLQKLAAGRVQHAVTDLALIEYYRKTGVLTLALHPPLPVKHYMGQCALSPLGQVTLAEVNGAIAVLLRDGAISAIAAKYR